MQCPKCSYEPTMAEMQRNSEECPSCGVIYAKLRKRAEEEVVIPKVGPSTKVTFSDWLNSSRHAKWAIALVVGLVVGYFIGREHVKYEIRSAMSDSLRGLASAFGGGKAGSVAETEREEAPPPKPMKAAPVKGALLSKGFHKGEYGQDQITFSLDFKNSGSKDVRAFEGVLKFDDLLGNSILSSNIAINDPVSAGASLRWDGGIKYNQFIDRHQRLRNEDAANIKMEFVLKKVLYTDGKTDQF